MLFSIDGYDIRTRRDVDRSFETWDDFLDRVAEAGLCLLKSGPSNDALLCFHSVARIVPEAERRDLVRELRRRMSGLCERRYHGKVAIQDRRTREGGFLQSLFRRAA
ncbi:hypothetical protein [Methylobacterium fujisawaense]|uniref:hypothetical protein n=1 Tax=Methylobacterium fujisawaense TaxID=107400 RepID=UPI0036F50144